MTAPEREPVEAADPDAEANPEPETLPANSWVTLGIFAAFVVLFAGCASTYLFR
ncbi:hypothetical protein [Leucobacter sp. M11]|uniref:hypothetical protein n=1 Tax=Leucobacter sp. M11 TaxID=2993565 RepID=UPI002D7FE127|nr:hypothetical protein [Leucobacter sp. M11]MEB4616381.1 hypothetical protein [Leucobacter sp. M11]